MTPNGKLRGLIKRYNNESVVQFLGVPYATAPLGELRFQKPVEHSNWAEVRNATSHGPSCMQALLGNDAWLLPNQDLSENCLHLNVYVPGEISINSSKPVMVWIHGGGFTAGQGMLIDGSYLALAGDVIVVTINYRLGVFGFLSTEDSNAPGNYGLWDQRFAIKWVKSNIVSFGGDPETITIFGESAGGYSVGLLSVSPRNKNLFQRAILESGAVYSPRALAKHSKTVANNLGKLLNCSMKSTSQLLKCLRAIPAIKLQSTYQNNNLYNSQLELSFENHMGPVVDGDLIVQDPIQSLSDTNSESYKMFQSIDMMAGTNNAEGGLLYFTLMRFQDKYYFNISTGIPKSVLCDIIAPAVSRDYFQNNDIVTKQICEQYSKDGASPAEISRSIVNVYADLQFVVPTVKTLDLHSKAAQPGKSSYHYVFTHQPSYTWIQDRPPWLRGANHAGELPFVFGLDAMYKPEVPKPSSERKLSRQMMLYWTNFAKTG